MNAGNKKTKKRKRSSGPVLKFTLILILLIAAGFFIFYSIDNPGFLKGKFSSLFSGEENNEAVPDLSASGEVQPINQNQEPSAIIDEAKNEEENSAENGEENTNQNELTSGGNDEVTGSSGSQSGLSFWQKIKIFFTRQGNDREIEETYPARLEINFYFSGLGEEKKLVSEKRTINAGSPDMAAKNAVQELLKGPSKSYHFPVIPAGTELLDAETNENIAKIDLSQEFLENSLDTRILDPYIIYSIVNTLTEIPDIEGVIFYIEGVRIRMYGNVDLSIPAIRNKEYISEQ